MHLSLRRDPSDRSVHVSFESRHPRCGHGCTDNCFTSDEDRAFCLPGGAVRDYGDPGIAFAVGGVALFLEDAEEVVAFKFPSAVHVYGILGW